MTTQAADERDGGRGPTLGELLTSLSVLEPIDVPRGLEVRVGTAVIHDPIVPPDIEPDCVLLAVGVDPSSPDAIDLVSRAGTSRAAAVAMKIAGDAPATLRGESERAGVALLAVPPEMTWSQAHSLIRTAVSAAGSEDDGVPLGDLFALANAVAAMIGGPVTIEDRRSVVLAYSSQDEGIDEPRRQTILGRQVPAVWLTRLEEEGVFRRLWAGEVVRYEGPPELALSPRLAVAVRAGDAILGSIWVAENDVPFGDEAADALREAARIAALHMIRHRAAGWIERGTRGELLRSILDGQGRIEAAAYRLGVRPDDRFAVVAFEPRSGDDVVGELQRERAIDLVALYCDAFRHRSAQVQLGRTIYVLLPGVERRERLISFAEEIVANARAGANMSLRAGIGSVVDHLRDVPRSRDEADKVLRVLAADTGTGDVADLASLHSRVVMTELSDVLSEHPHLRSHRLATLRAHDAEHKTSYVQTLRAFMDAFGDIPAAARRINVHPNTFRYRLRRLVEMSGIDLSDPDERLLAEIDIRLTESG